MFLMYEMSVRESFCFEDGVFIGVSVAVVMAVLRVCQGL